MGTVTATQSVAERPTYISYTVHHVERKEIKEFIEEHHYTKSINGVHTSHCFALKDGEKIVGAAIVGILAMAGVSKRYESLGYNAVMELRRLVLIDDTPRNSESWFIGRILRWFKQNTSIDLLVAYSDPYYGHTGIIYQASNFVKTGVTGKDHKIEYNGRLYHSKSLRTRNSSGDYKPFVKTLRDAYDRGEAKKIDIPGKFVYLYSIRDKKFRNNTNTIRKDNGTI